jgi:4-hydroxy-3-methylbut-2-enyl diphosphate reductase
VLKKIILANPRGFCAGVDRAITIVEEAIALFGAPVYVRHQIVHNEFVVKMLEQKGAIFVEELSEIPENSTVIFSAHGIPPAVREEAKKRHLHAIDATCPLVTKVHMEALKYQKEGYEIVLIGHKGHQEVIGTMGHAHMHLVQTSEDVDTLTLDETKKIACITQTTLSLDDTAEIMDALKKRYPNINTLPKKDICYATQNRQNAVKALADQTDLILVVGSHNSSNSKRLVDTSKRFGTNAFLLPDLATLKLEWLEGVTNVGISSGASVPEELVQGLVDFIQNHFPEATREFLTTIEENVRFPLPKEITQATT